MPIVLVRLLLLTMAAAQAGNTPAPLRLTFLNRHESMAVDLYAPAGGVRRGAQQAVDHLLRCWRTERERPIDVRLLQIVAQVSSHFGDAEIEVVSGYRARPYGAPHSKHFLGRAMDIRVPGVRARALRDWIWQNFRGIGVGYYPEQGFVHVDVREQDTAWIDHARSGESAARVRYFGRDGAEQTSRALVAASQMPLQAP
jgi:uncharacterized protein YcbK (DUF882 family)